MATIPIYMGANRPKGGTDMNKAKSANQLGGNLMEKLVPEKRKFKHEAPLSELIREWVEQYDKLLPDATVEKLMALLVNCPYHDLPKRGELQVKILAMRRAALPEKDLEPESPVQPPICGPGRTS